MADAAALTRLNRRGRGRIGLVVGVVLAACCYLFCGFDSIQPIGAVPDGATVVVWRGSGKPFFNSPDALCRRRTGGVSLLCRGLVIGPAPTDRVILRLPPQLCAYDLSTGSAHSDR